MNFEKPLFYHTVEFAGFVASNFEGYVTKSAPHKALKLIVRDMLTFDERVVLHRVEGVSWRDDAKVVSR